MGIDRWTRVRYPPPPPLKNSFKINIPFFWIEKVESNIDISEICLHYRDLWQTFNQLKKGLDKQILEML